MVHIALPAALATHSLPGEHLGLMEEGALAAPPGLLLTWRLGQLPDRLVSGHWSSVHAWAACLMRASVRSVTVRSHRQLLCMLGPISLRSMGA